MPAGRASNFIARRARDTPSLAKGQSCLLNMNGCWITVLVAFHPAALSSVRPSPPRAAPTSAIFIRPVLKRAEPISVRQGFAIPLKVSCEVTTRASCSGNNIEAVFRGR
jgi:hypothetical protein